MSGKLWKGTASGIGWDRFPCTDYYRQAKKTVLIEWSNPLSVLIDHLAYCLSLLYIEHQGEGPDVRDDFVINTRRSDTLLINYHMIR